MIFRVLKETEIPATQLMPTHVNRNTELFEQGIELVKQGGYIDLTTSSDPNFLEEGELSASEGLKRALDTGINMNNITFTSDGNGSMPKFDENGKLIGLGICSVSSLYNEVKRAIKEQNVPIEIAVKVITSNVADLLRLGNKGRIISRKDADFVLVDKDDLSITDVYAKGEALIEEGRIIKKGIFE